MSVILFVRVHNAGRSQMAAALIDALALERLYALNGRRAA